MQLPLTQSRLIQITNLFEGYAKGLITDDELDDMHDLLFGDL